MIAVPQSTVAKPLTPLDYIACLPQCITAGEVAAFCEQLPIAVRHDERFAKAVRARLAELRKPA